MAGGPSTVALTVAVSDAGGLGFLAAGYRSAAQVREDIRSTRAATDSPFGVNLFVPGAHRADASALDAYLATLAPEAERYGVVLGEPRSGDDGWEEKLAVLAEERVPVVSFTFGCPPQQVVGTLRETGSEVWVTVSRVADARVAAACGAGALVVQGAEAGGHRASFDDAGDGEEVGLLPLLRLVRGETTLPLVAAGGLGDAASLAAALVAGAAAGQLGTAFLCCPEAATHPAHRDALARTTPTSLTRAFTGRLARGLSNRFQVQHTAAAPSAYPEIHHATAPLRAEARARGDGDGFNLWAGQAHQLCSERPAAEIVRTLSREARLCLQQTAERYPPAPGL